MHFDMNDVAAALGLDDEAIERRKAFLNFTTDDAARLRELNAMLKAHTATFVEHFYRHLSEFDETGKLLSDPATLKRLQNSQARYFDGLTAGDYGRDYVLDRLLVGSVHHHVGLAPSWYLGAYANYLVDLFPEVQARLNERGQDFMAAAQSLVKIVLFDVSLAIDTYIAARDQTILGLKNHAEVVFDSIHAGILVLSSDLSVLSSNRAFRNMFALSRNEVAGRRLADIIATPALEQRAHEVARHGAEYRALPLQLETITNRLCKQVRVTLRRIASGSGETDILLVVEEISAEERLRREAESRLLRNEAMLRQAQSVARIGSWSLHPDGRGGHVLEWSAETYRLFGLALDTPVDYPLFLARVHPEDRLRVDKAWRDAQLGKPYRVEHRIELDGQALWLENRAELEFDDDGQMICAIGTVQDITERMTAEHQIEQLAFFDALTGLPNRALFQDRLNQALAHADRHNLPVALMFIDLDRFKEINDTQGHDCGDLVLTEVARRFETALRQDETLARLGGDEFVVIAHKTDRTGASVIAERLIGTLAPPIAAKNQHFTLGASIGIALYPEDGQDSRQLLKHSDIAMYRAKTTSSGFCFYGAEMGHELARRLEVAMRFNDALNEQRLQLHYQPQCDIESGRLTGAEALLRWFDPDWGWMSPAEFIPIAESRGMMTRVGEWVLNTVCHQLRKWRHLGHTLNGRVAINVAAQQIEQHDFAQRALAIARSTGVAPTQIEFEITESGMMRDPESAMRVTHELVKAGFTISIDDFGTGHSSLAYLKRFPADKLKIDMSFVRHMLRDRNDHSIVATVVAMARSLGLKALAEGVEHAEQADSLFEMGCSEAQGYLFGKPVGADDFAARWFAAA